MLLGRGVVPRLMPLGARTVVVEKRLAEKGLTLPLLAPVKGNYVMAVRTGNLIFLAGHLPMLDGKPITGKLGKDKTVQDGYAAAARVGLSMLSTLKNEIGDLDKIKRVVKVTGLVNSTPDFSDHPLVINGCSDLLVSALGDAGKHARVAAGYANLPLNVIVELDMIVEVAEE